MPLSLRCFDLRRDDQVSVTSSGAAGSVIRAAIAAVILGQGGRLLLPPVFRLLHHHPFKGAVGKEGHSSSCLWRRSYLQGDLSDLAVYVVEQAGQVVHNAADQYFFQPFGDLLLDEIQTVSLPLNTNSKSFVLFYICY